ncbi:DUF3421 domain-containing protein [Legionella sp.]|uniref:DUF3421 domain-containing protein n=1 Tax=Legionella sp. TaxID=459 RepID=UPI000CAAA83C|nr:MAG: hypothetical protein CK430_00750 [Legionella sp.]
MCFFFSLFLNPIWAGTSHHHDHDTPYEYDSHNHSYNNFSFADAFQTGIDTNGKPLYLCIGKLLNSDQPGKTWEGYGRCNVAYGGKEFVVDRFEVPSRARFKGAYWQANPRTAIRVGTDTNGKPLFLCQAYFRGSRQPGKTWPGYNRCNISYGGREIIIDSYLVLGANRQIQGEERHGYPGPESIRIEVRP